MIWEILLLLVSILMLVFALYSRQQSLSSQEKCREIQSALDRETAERQRLEQALRQTEQRFEQIMDNIPLALYIREPIRDTSATYMSRAYEKLWEQPRQQLYSNSRAWLEPVHPDDLPKVNHAIEHSYATHIPIDTEFRIVHQNGTIRWVHLQNFHINPDAAGKPERVVGIIADITERRSAEQDRIKLGVEQERNQFLRQLISTISHDFRTPMTTINTNTYLLKRALDNESHRQRLTVIEQQVQRIDKLLEDTLTMMKLDGNVQLDRLPTDLNLMMRELEPDIRAIMERKHQLFTFEPSHDALPVRIHQERVGQAIMYLVENASQFSGEGQPIAISTVCRAGFAVVEVRDNGIGIAPDDLPHIFEPFYRSDQSRSTRTGGAGVGLTIAKRVADLHQGQIQVESTVGQGSTFRVLLPMMLEVNQPS